MYRWYEGDKQRTLSSIDLGKLEEKVKSKGLPWSKIGE